MTFLEKTKCISKMEDLFHQRMQTIVKNKKNRSDIFGFIEKKCFDDSWMTSCDKRDYLLYIIYEIHTEWNVIPKLDELFEWIKSNPFGYNHESYQTYRHILKEEDDFIENPPSVDEGVNQCLKCKSFRTFSFTKQTRSSDEAATVFVRCTECGFKFKI